MKLKYYKRIKALACSENCAKSFKCDREAGLSYGLHKYADGSFAKSREEASIREEFCAYCGIHNPPVEMKKTFRVVAVSDNFNSFGLRQYVLIARDGQAFKVCRSDFNGNPKWTQGQDIEIMYSSSTTFNWAKHSCELPDELPPAPKKVLKEIFI